jgi:hypothetical protein
MPRDKLPTVIAMHEYVRKSTLTDGSIRVGFADRYTLGNDGSVAVEPHVSFIHFIFGGGLLAGCFSG